MAIRLVSSLPPVPTPAKASATPLAAWVCAVNYVGDQGVRRVPVCGGFGAAARIVRQTSGKCDKVIKWFAMGWGGKPPIPSFDTGSANEILASWEIGKAAEGKWIDGQDVVGIMGEYRYYLQVIPNLATDVLSFCTAPWASNSSLSVYQLTPGDFSSLFVSPSATPAGFGGGLIRLP